MKTEPSNSPRIDWQTGTWERPDVSGAAADVLIAGDWAPIRDFSGPAADTPLALYGNLLPLLRECHLRIVNLECPLVDGGKPINKSGSVLKGASRHIAGLTEVPFDVVTLGNNHAFDYGEEAFSATLKLLDKNGILRAGAGLSKIEAEKPLLVKTNGIHIGVINFCEGEDLTAASEDRPGVFGWDVDRVVDLVRHIRPDVHVIIVICHGGVEYIPFPPPYLARALRRVADAGADLIIGHHPHVPQGIEIHSGVPICYSLGNFVFHQPTGLRYRKIGYLVKASATAEGLRSIRVVPYEIGTGGLTLLEGEKLRRTLRKLEAISAPLPGEDGINDAWRGFLKYYGVNGFKKEISSIMDKFEHELPKGAAMFRNRLTTMQHYHHLKDLMTQIVDGTIDSAPQWAVESVADYFTRRIEDGLPE